ncbi:HD-GYP domain-containing protein [bacterium]|nr:HD-GYP domain-containing protein [candidate division CSSED10-310 bacterium]
MKLSKQKLLDELLNLRQSGDHSQDDSTSGVNSNDIPHQIITAPMKNIIDAFEHTNHQIEMLTDEILLCYDQINAAFQATRSVAGHHTTPDAILAMLESISRAIQARYAYYWGTLAEHFSLLNENEKPKELLIPFENDTQQPAEAVQYFDTHRDTFLQLARSERSVSVHMIDNNGPFDPDNVGHGNVISIQIRINMQDFKQLGTLFFVRSAEQPPFHAIQMNLADILSQTGAAILTNIIYAQKLHQTYLQSITSLVRAMEAKDPYTSGHSSRVAASACRLARAVQRPEHEIQLLEWAGLLHDVGKIGIRDQILRKPGPLTPEEFKHVKSHPVKSYNVLEPIDALRNILAVVRHHHEHYDGSGYPDGLIGDEIPLLARILQVTDIWDALTSTRSYRRAITKEESILIMKEEAGTTMDPQLVEPFLTLVEHDDLLS